MASPFFFGCWRDRPDSNRSLDSPRSNSDLALCKKNGWLKLRHKLLEASRFRGTPQFQLWNKSVLLCSHQSSGNIIRKKTTTLDRTYKTSYLRMILDWIPIKKTSVQRAQQRPMIRPNSGYEVLDRTCSNEFVRTGWSIEETVGLFEHVWTCLNIAGKTSNAYYGLSSWSLMCAIRTGVKWGIHRYPPCLDKPRIWTHTKFTLPSVSGANCQCFK